MLRKLKPKTSKIISLFILAGTLFTGFFANIPQAKAVDCDELGSGENVTATLPATALGEGSNWIISNKDPNKVIGLDEEFVLYFQGLAQNGDNDPPDPNWFDCQLELGNEKYVVGFVVHPKGQPLASQGWATVKPKFTRVVDGYEIKAGITTTLSKIVDSQYRDRLTNVYIYAYICPNETCPQNLFGLWDFGYVAIQTDGQPGDRNAGTINDALIEQNQDALGSPSYLDAKNFTSERSSTVGTLMDFIAEAIGGIIQILTTLIYWLFAFIVAPLIEAVLSIHPYEDIFVQVIYPGWLILRNLSNILFIIILLIIGLATLFQVEKYNYKHLLVQVLIAAVMVNFSLVIGQAVLGIADTVQNQFLPDRTNVIRSLGYELMVRPIQMMQLNSNTAGAGLANVTYPFFLFALALGAFFSFVAILVFLVVRIVALWILLMVSPIAYVARILPETEKYAAEWWNKFLMYAFITPIFAFFLNIAALFANSHVLSKGTELLDTTAISGNVEQFVYLTASHITVLVFLLAGLSFAGSSGVVGAKAMTEFVKKGMSKPFTFTGGALADRVNRYKTQKAQDLFTPKEGDRFFARTFKKGAMMAATPKSSWKGYKAQDEEKKKSLHGKSEAIAFDAFRRGIPLGITSIGSGPASRKLAEFEEHEVQERMKNAADQKNPAAVAKMIEEARKTGDKLGVMAGIRLAWKNSIEVDVLEKLGEDQSNLGAYNLLNHPDNKLTEHEKQTLASEMNAASRTNGSFVGANLYKYKENKWAVTPDQTEDEQYNALAIEQEKAAAKKSSLAIGQDGSGSAVVDTNNDGTQHLNYIGSREFLKAMSKDANGNFTGRFNSGILDHPERLNEKVKDALTKALEGGNFELSVDAVEDYLAKQGVQNINRGQLETDLHAFGSALRAATGQTGAASRYGAPGAGQTIYNTTNTTNNQNVNNRTTVGGITQNVTNNARFATTDLPDFSREVEQALHTAVRAGRGNAARAFAREATKNRTSRVLIQEHETNFTEAARQPDFDFNQYASSRRDYLSEEVTRLENEVNTKAGTERAPFQQALDRARRSEVVGNAYLDAQAQDI